MNESSEPVLQSRKRQPLAELPIDDLQQIDLILQQITMNSQSSLGEVLNSHRIPPSLRARMVDWMTEIVNAFGLKHRSLFLAVCLMDLFFKNTQREFNSQSLHLIGVVCVMIASKFNDSRCINVELAQYVSRETLGEREIVEMEIEVFKVVNDHLAMTTCYDVLMVLCEKYKVPRIVKRCSISGLYLMQVYYDMLKLSVNEQAYCAFLFSLCYFKQKNIMDAIRSEGDCVVEVRMLEMAVSAIAKFNHYYPSLVSAQRFLGFEFNKDSSGELILFSPSSRFD